MRALPRRLELADNRPTVVGIARCFFEKAPRAPQMRLFILGEVVGESLGKHDQRLVVVPGPAFEMLRAAGAIRRAKESGDGSFFTMPRGREWWRFLNVRAPGQTTAACLVTPASSSGE